VDERGKDRAHDPSAGIEIRGDPHAGQRATERGRDFCDREPEEPIIRSEDKPDRAMGMRQGPGEFPEDPLGRTGEVCASQEVGGGHPENFFVFE
jgi:hypothetical protein